MHRFPDTPAIHPAKVQAYVYRAPIDEPVRTSFGVMRDRPAVLVRIEDRDGAWGWGEIWCNFPGVGAEHRARMLESCVAPILLEQQWAHPTEAFESLGRRLEVLAIQTGEPGTVAQAIAGADMALWDLAARRLGQPLWRLFGGTPRIATYASGLSPDDPQRLAAAKHAEGYRAFKLKVGFGEERDTLNLRALREQFGPDTALMVDANQAWDDAAAAHMSRRLAEYGPIWLEEPLRADASPEQWRRLAQAGPLPLAAGENLRGAAQFDQAIDSGTFAVIQPDPGKWGGFSGCLPVARRAIAAQRMFCPHWLGGGVGLVAAMQLKASVGQPGYVEVDSNPNPLRDLFAGPLLRLDEGMVTLPDTPGLGMEPDLAGAREFLVPHDYR
jgi:L-alanine-DL-glutamate epimerase-like enolase superfamily enzyme